MTATDLVQFGATDLRVSRICQGTAFRNMPREAGNIAGQKVLEHCIEAGVNFFDSSNAYGWGGSEELLGKAMAGKRDHVVVCTKVAVSYGPEDESLPREPARFTREFLFHQVEASLSRLGTEYTDLYLLHQPDGVTPAEEIADSMEALIAAGKVRYWGVSNHCAEQLSKYISLSKAIGASHFAGVEEYYNIAGESLDEGGQSRTRRMEREIFPLLREARLGLVSFSPHDMGYLVPGKAAEPGTPLEALLRVIDLVAGEFGVPRSRVCVAWVLAHPEITSALGAAESPEHVDDNVAGGQLELPSEVMDTLNDASIAFSDQRIMDE